MSHVPGIDNSGIGQFRLQLQATVDDALHFIETSLSAPVALVRHATQYTHVFAREDVDNAFRVLVVKVEMFHGMTFGQFNAHEHTSNRAHFFVAEHFSGAESETVDDTCHLLALELVDRRLNGLDVSLHEFAAKFGDLSVT